MEMSLINKNAGRIIILWIIVLSLLYSLLSILRHNHFQSGAFDLGLYDQSVWQFSQFQSPFNTIKERFIWGDHLTLTLPLLAPLFWLWDDVKILLIFQALWISLSALPIYKLALIRGFSKVTSLNFALIYSFFPGIQFAIFFDFHPAVIGTGLLSWMIYFLEAHKKRLFWLSLILFLLTQENMGIALAALGFIYLFDKKYRKMALGFITGGFIYSLLAVKIIAYFSPVGFQYWPVVSLNPIKILSGFFDSEEKRLVWLYSFSWFSFLPLFSIGTLMAVFFDLSQYFVAAPNYSHMWGPFLHHRVILAPLMILGVIQVLSFWQKVKINSSLSKIINLQNISLGLVIIALILQYYFHFPLNKLSKSDYWQNEPWMNDNQQLFKQIPKRVSLAAAQNLVPHLSHRKEIYLVWPRKRDFDNKLCGQKTCWWLDFAGKPEYLVVDLHPNQWLTQLLQSNENFQSAVLNMEKAGKITLEKQINFAKFYRINY